MINYQDVAEISNKSTHSADIPWYFQPTFLIAIIVALLSYILYPKFFKSENLNSCKNDTVSSSVAPVTAPTTKPKSSASNPPCASSSDPFSPGFDPLKNRSKVPSSSNTETQTGKSVFNSITSRNSKIIIKKAEQNYDGPLSTDGEGLLINHNDHDGSYVEMELTQNAKDTLAEIAQKLQKHLKNGRK